MMRLEWSPEALEDLGAIYEIIALDNEDAAMRFVSQLQEKARNLLDLRNATNVVEKDPTVDVAAFLKMVKELPELRESLKQILIDE